MKKVEAAQHEKEKLILKEKWRERNSNDNFVKAKESSYPSTKTYEESWRWQIQKTGENKELKLTPEEKEELILKGKCKEKDTLIKPVPILKCPQSFPQN